MNSTPENQTQHTAQRSMKFCPRCATALEEADHQGATRPTCPSCGYVSYNDPKVAVAVITGRDGKVLLACRNHEPKMGLWTFPSGYVDAGEVVEDAAIRETEEETGVHVQLERLLAVQSEPGNRVVLVVYTGSIIGGEMRAGTEATAVGLFSLDNLPDLAFTHDRELIEAWAHELQPPLKTTTP